MSMPNQPDYSSWGGLISAVASVGAGIYTAKLQKQAAKRQARAQANDFPMLGNGLMATGPQRNGLLMLGDGGGSSVVPWQGFPYQVDAGGSSTAPDASGGTMAGNVVGVSSRPVYAIASTPSGAQRIIGMRSMGTPLLWSGDFAAVKRVARVARKLGRFVHRRPR